MSDKPPRVTLKEFESFMQDTVEQSRIPPYELAILVAKDLLNAHARREIELDAEAGDAALQMVTREAYYAGRAVQRTERIPVRPPAGSLKLAARLLPARLRRDCLDEWKDHVIEAQKAGRSARLTRVSILFRALLPLAIRSRMRVRRRSVRKP